MLYLFFREKRVRSDAGSDHEHAAAAVECVGARGFVFNSPGGGVSGRGMCPCSGRYVFLVSVGLQPGERTIALFSLLCAPGYPVWQVRSASRMSRVSCVAIGPGRWIQSHRQQLREADKVFYAAVAVVDLQGQGAQTAELAQVLSGPANLAGRRIIVARGNMLMDAVSPVPSRSAYA